MVKLGKVARYVRSKNAGPFWITLDVFFADREDFERYAGALRDDKVAARLGVDVESLRRYPVPDLFVIKFSFPRENSQGGASERDMHAGQAFVPLLDLEL
jgi:hypothetical protein